MEIRLGMPIGTILNIGDTIYVRTRDEFELEFSGSSEPEL